jgi:hypothetical protein
MNKTYFLFSRLRFRDSIQTPTENRIKQIEECLSVCFNEEATPGGLSEKELIAELLGMEINLEFWRDKDELVYALSGRSEIYNDWEQEDVININQYIIHLFDSKNMKGWYMPSIEEMQRDSDLSGGEHAS